MAEVGKALTGDATDTPENLAFLHELGAKTQKSPQELATLAHVAPKTFAILAAHYGVEPPKASAKPTVTYGSITFDKQPDSGINNDSLDAFWKWASEIPKTRALLPAEEAATHGALSTWDNTPKPTLTPEELRAAGRSAELPASPVPASPPGGSGAAVATLPASDLNAPTVSPGNQGPELVGPEPQGAAAPPNAVGSALTALSGVHAPAAPQVSPAVGPPGVHPVSAVDPLMLLAALGLGHTAPRQSLRAAT